MTNTNGITYLVECRSCHKTVFFSIVAAFCKRSGRPDKRTRTSDSLQVRDHPYSIFGGEREYSRKFSDDIDAIFLDDARQKYFHIMVILNLRSQVGIREELFAYFGLITNSYPETINPYRIIPLIIKSYL